MSELDHLRDARTGTTAIDEPPKSAVDEHGEHPYAHQFENANQQHEVATLGMWAFLATEVLFFGGMFAAYTVYRRSYPEEFVASSHRLYDWIGAINTGVLLCSSLTAALAVRAAQLVNRINVFRFLIATALLGACFLAIKGTEYYIDYREHLIPKLNFHLQEAEFPAEVPAYDKPADAFVNPYLNARKQQEELFSQHMEMFMLFYFVMTGVHATHMIIGISVILILAFRVRAGRYQFQNHNSIEMTGLYWHFVDVVWIFLFPLLYLIR